MSGALKRIDAGLAALFDDQPTPGRRAWSQAARVVASVAVTLTGVFLLVPNLTPLLVGERPPVVVALAAFGSVVCVGLAVSGYLLYRSDFSTANAVRIAVWNVLGVVVLGAVLWLHGTFQGTVGLSAVTGDALTAGNILAISTAAHVIIGVHDARRVRAEQLARERRKLAVLNRVLRHNLRNEATVLMGHSDRLAAAVDDPDLAESARVVNERARAVGALADKTKEVIDLFDRESPVQRPRPVDDLVERAMASVDGVAADVDVPDDCWMWADDCYETALAELVENAVEHGEPPVRIRVTVDDGWVRTDVVDAGGGIPRTEATVVGGEADITQLQHASGMGLWLARAAAEANGGRLTFETRGDETVVRLSHRRATPAA